MERDVVGVGIIGYGWITRAHAHALHTLNHVAPPARPIRLVALAGRRPEPLEAAAQVRLHGVGRDAEATRDHGDRHGGFGGMKAGCSSSSARMTAA
jgi:predicted dehydrogenase